KGSCVARGGKTQSQRTGIPGCGTLEQHNTGRREGNDRSIIQKEFDRQPDRIEAIELTVGWRCAHILDGPTIWALGATGPECLSGISVECILQHARLWMRGRVAGRRGCERKQQTADAEGAKREPITADGEQNLLQRGEGKKEDA